MSVYRKLLSLAFAVFNGVSATIAIIMMLIVVSDVMIRTITGQGISGSVQMIELGMLAVVFFAIANTQKLGEHVSVELIITKLPLKCQKILAIIMLLIYMTFTCVLTYYTFTRANESRVQGEVMWMGVEVIPQWPFRYIIPVGLFLLFLRLIDELLYAFSDLKATSFSVEGIR
ncbi:TRAP transporter small permease [bacterium]|nr:TRAP transporter small permease [bacterium]